MLENNYQDYEKQRKEKRVEERGYNYNFNSKDNEWNIDLRISKMNDINIDCEDLTFNESKAEGIFKNKRKTMEDCKIHLVRVKDIS